MPSSGQASPLLGTGNTSPTSLSSTSPILTNLHRPIESHRFPNLRSSSCPANFPRGRAGGSSSSSISKQSGDNNAAKLSAHRKGAGSNCCKHSGKSIRVEIKGPGLPMHFPSPVAAPPSCAVVRSREYGINSRALRRFFKIRPMVSQVLK